MRKSQDITSDNVSITSWLPILRATRSARHRTRQVFDRYNIVSEKDLREAVSKSVTYVEGLPSKPSVVPIQNVSGMVQRENTDKTRTIC